jgi:copper(I)-binding protein
MKEPTMSPANVWKILAFASALTLPALPASARDFKLKDIVVQHPWARATPKAAEVASGYLVIKNNGHDPDKLTGGSADFADHVEVHEVAVDNGVTTMRPLENGLDIKPGASVELKPGSYHLMFTELKHPLKKGEHVRVTLTFEKAGSLPVEFTVQGVGAKSGDENKMDMPMD